LPELVATSGETTRQRDLSLLAKARPDDVLAAFDSLPDRPASTFLRPPETGMVMTRGRVGGSGAPFNLGEMTVSRAVVRLEDGEVGVGYVAGRNKRHAEIAAIVDAMLQSGRWRDMARSMVIEPLAASAAERRATASRKAAATRVEFFTMVRDRKS
jgi:alpha-D-ribose 1-methylphosphonate 5-triphosphate synthase subunit PhnG